MPRPNQLHASELASYLRRHGPVSATEIAKAFQVNRTTVVRAFEGLGEELMTVGAARGTRYLLRRDVRGVGNRWPVYRIEESGRARPLGRLEALAGDRPWRMQWAEAPPAWADRFEDRNGLWESFPFFLGDVRPQGFLGRAIAREVGAMLAVPDDPRRWSDDDVLLYLQAQGEDLPGDQVIGDECLRRAMAKAVSPSPESVVEDTERSARYPLFAERAGRGTPGTSAGGEQPKFLVTRLGADERRSHVLVKYSPVVDQAVGQRWADLLLAEYHAHAVLAEEGLAVGAELIDAGGRRFLEMARFDRAGTSGRRGIVSLESLHAAAMGTYARDWPAALDGLRREGLVDDDAVETVRRLHAFGELIGNTDMHAGNLSFWLEDAPQFRVAPAYDMLPMMWAPGPQGELAWRAFAPRPPLPAVESAWQEAAGWAERFWNRLAEDPRLSPELKSQAELARETVETLRAFVGVNDNL
jgi:hypothetical protein